MAQDRGRDTPALPDPDWRIVATEDYDRDGKVDIVWRRDRYLRGGERLNDPRFKTRIVGEGIFAEQIRDLFAAGCKRAGMGDRPVLSTAAFRRPNEQLSLF